MEDALNGSTTNSNLTQNDEDIPVDLNLLAMAETNNDPTAVSEDGAVGHIQMMPSTYDNLKVEAQNEGVIFPEQLEGVSIDEAVANPEILELAGTVYLKVLSSYLKELDIPVNTQNLIGAWNMGADGYFAALATGNFPEETVQLWKRYGIEGNPTAFDASTVGKSKGWKKWLEISSNENFKQKMKKLGIDPEIVKEAIEK